MPIEYLIVLVVVMVLECLTAYSVGLRTLRYQGAIMLVNLFTVPPLSYLVWIDLIHTLPVYLASKVGVTLFEILMLMCVLHDRSKRLMMAVILMNLVSFAASVLYASLRY